MNKQTKSLNLKKNQNPCRNLVVTSKRHNSLFRLNLEPNKVFLEITYRYVSNGLDCASFGLL